MKNQHEIMRGYELAPSTSHQFGLFDDLAKEMQAKFDAAVHEEAARIAAASADAKLGSALADVLREQDAMLGSALAAERSERLSTDVRTAVRREAVRYPELHDMTDDEVECIRQTVLADPSPYVQRGQVEDEVRKAAEAKRVAPVAAPAPSGPAIGTAEHRAELRSQRAAKAAKTRSMVKAEAKRAASERGLRARTAAGWHSRIKPGRVTWDEEHRTSVIEWPSMGDVVAPASAYPTTAHEEMDADLVRPGDADAEVEAERFCPEHGEYIGVVCPSCDDAEATSTASPDPAALADPAKVDELRKAVAGLRESIRHDLKGRGLHADEILEENLIERRIPATLEILRRYIHDEYMEPWMRSIIAEEQAKLDAEAPAETPAPTVEAPEPEPEPVPEPAPVVPGATYFDSAMLARVRRMADRIGPALLFGPTATGKTSMITHIAHERGIQSFLVQMQPGINGDNLYGITVARDGIFVWEDREVLQWARHVAAGNAGYLIIDEIARGGRTVNNDVLPMLNLYTAEQVAVQGLPVPVGQPGPYHIIKVPLTGDVFVLSAQLGKIWATANLGDTYEGVSLSDPAFRNRWVAGFLEIQAHTGDELRAILLQYVPALPEGSTGLLQTQQIVQAIVATHEKLGAMHVRERNLAMMTNLRTLIAWVQEALRLGTGGAMTKSQALLTAAEDLFVDMIVPLDGDRTDAEIRKAVMKILQETTR